MKTDLSYLKTMSGDSQELILEMIDIFIEQVCEFTREMQKHLDTRDYDSLGKLAHKAKSSVSIMGMTELSGKLKELEIFTRNKENTGQYQAYVNFFAHECKEAIKELNQHKTLLTEPKS